MCVTLARPCHPVSLWPDLPTPLGQRGGGLPWQCWLVTYRQCLQLRSSRAL